MIKFNNFCDRNDNALDIRFTKRCDNNCSFCIDKTGLGDLGDAPVEDLIKKTIDQKLDIALILGGEPFIKIKKLERYVRGIRPYVKEIYITTSLPRSIKKHPSYFESIMRNIDGLNVSILSVDSADKNNDMLNASSRHDRLKMLEKINMSWGYKTRTSINLVKGGIDSKKELVMSLLHLEILGCQEIKIVELQHASDDYISYEDIMHKKMKSPYAHGCQTVVEIPGIECKTVLKRSCFVVEESRNASFLDLIKTLIKKYFIKQTGRFSVLYEDASVKNNWVVI